MYGGAQMYEEHTDVLGNSDVWMGIWMYWGVWTYGDVWIYGGHVHHLSIEIEGKKLQKCLNVHL